MTIEIRLLGPDDRSVLDRVALDDGTVVGMASAVNYVNPDKPPELWINEVGVAPTHRRRGVGRGLLQALLARGRALGCAQAWVLTDTSNPAAQRLYAAGGGRAAAEACRMFEFPLGPPGGRETP